ncbi:hypothetical protein Tco_0026627 [Tanacetum coccineum]
MEGLQGRVDSVVKLIDVEILGGDQCNREVWRYESCRKFTIWLEEKRNLSRWDSTGELAADETVRGSMGDVRKREIKRGSLSDSTRAASGVSASVLMWRWTKILQVDLEERVLRRGMKHLLQNIVVSLEKYCSSRFHKEDIIEDKSYKSLLSTHLGIWSGWGGVYYVELGLGKVQGGRGGVQSVTREGLTRWDIVGDVVGVLRCGESQSVGTPVSIVTMCAGIDRVSSVRTVGAGGIGIGVGVWWESEDLSLSDIATTGRCRHSSKNVELPTYTSMVGNHSARLFTQTNQRLRTSSVYGTSSRTRDNVDSTILTSTRLGICSKAEMVVLLFLFILLSTGLSGSTRVLCSDYDRQTFGLSHVGISDSIVHCLSGSDISDGDLGVRHYCNTEGLDKVSIEYDLCFLLVDGFKGDNLWTICDDRSHSSLVYNIVSYKGG